MTEQYIQSSIRDRLVKSGWMVTKLISTSTPGIPDLMALKSGRAVFIEVKRPGQKPTPLQSHVHKRLTEQGFEVTVATSKEDVQHLFLSP
jgi:Holliday junction resolvase